MHAILQIIVRYLGRYESTETIAFYFFVIGLFLTALPLPFIAVRPTLAEVPLLVGVGLSGAAAQWLLTFAFRNAKAAIVTVFNYSSIVWATLFGWLIWNEWPLTCRGTGRRNRHRLKHPDDLARESPGQNFRRARSCEAVKLYIVQLQPLNLLSRLTL